MRRRNAFTLVELLVVIGIIALLIGILMPALIKARQQANATKCASNLHSMGIALTMYTQQYNAYPGHASIVAGTTAAIWPTRLRQFTSKEQGIWHCPSQEADFEWSRTPGAKAKLATAADSKFGYETGEAVLDVFSVPSCYGYNDWGARPPTTDPKQQKGLGGDIPPLANKTPEVRVSQVRSASDMIAIADSMSDRWWDWNIDPLDPLKREYPGKIHNKGANVLFCDAHVEWHSQKELITLRINGQATPMASRWNNDNQP